jgi:hypothetical protein
MSHGLRFRKARETRELANVAAISKGAVQYARNHGGEFPDSLSTMLLDGELKLQDLGSSYGSSQQPADVQRLTAELTILQMLQQIPDGLPVDRDVLIGPLDMVFGQDVDEKSDYQYFGAGLRLPDTRPAAALPEEIILATSRFAISGSQMTVAYADGSATFLDLANAESALIASNAARTANGFDAVRPPDVVQRAQKYKQAPSGPRD